MRPHRRQIEPDLVGSGIGDPIPDEWRVGVLSRRVAWFQCEDHAAFICHPFRQGIGGCSLEVRAAIRHQQHRRLSTTRTSGGRRIEICFNLNSRLAVELDVLAPTLRSVRLIQHGPSRRGAIGGDPQSTQFSLQFQDCSLPFLGVKIVKYQLVEFAASRDILDMASGRDQQIKIAIETHWLFN